MEVSLLDSSVVGTFLVIYVSLRINLELSTFWNCLSNSDRSAHSEVSTKGSCYILNNLTISLTFSKLIESTSSEESTNTIIILLFILLFETWLAT